MATDYMTTISQGPPTQITLDTEYALPPRAGVLLSDQVIQISADRITWTDLTGSNTVGARVAGGFIRCHVDDATVVIKSLRK